MALLPNSQGWPSPSQAATFCSKPALKLIILTHPQPFITRFRRCVAVHAGRKAKTKQKLHRSGGSAGGAVWWLPDGLRPPNLKHLKILITTFTFLPSDDSGAASPSTAVANSAGGLAVLLAALFGGFLMSRAQMPALTRWLSSLSFVR